MRAAVRTAAIRELLLYTLSVASLDARGHARLQELQTLI
jgi:hypothetical protein